MNIFNNNLKNSREIHADSIYLSSALPYQSLTISENGEIKPSTITSFSTINILEGVTMCNLQNGINWLNSNNKDESKKLQDFLDDTDENFKNLGISNLEKTICIDSKNGYLFLNDRITVPNYINLDFKGSKVAMGRNFRINVTGSYNQTPPNIENAPRLNATALQGSKTITVVDESNNFMPLFNSGDKIALSDIILNKRQDNIISSKSFINSNVWRINLVNPIDDFDLGSNSGRVRKYDFTLFNSNCSVGDTRVYVQNMTIVEKGQYVAFVDQRQMGDIYGTSSNVFNKNGDSNNRLWYSRNNFNHQIRQVVDVVNNNSLISGLFSGYIDLNAGLSKPLDVVNGYVIVLRPRENVKIQNLTTFMIDEFTNPYTRLNNHAILLDTCLNSKVENCAFSDKWDFLESNVAQGPLIDNFIRLRECYNCEMNDVKYYRHNNQQTGSGASYAFTCYLSSFCKLNNLYASGCRHNLLLQSVDHTRISDGIFLNTFISGVDLHGLKEDYNEFNNILIEGARETGTESSGSLSASQHALLRLGNSTHGGGASRNIFRNITIRNALSDSNINADYTKGMGIDVVPESSGNLFENIYIENCDTAINMNDHVRGRLNIFSLSNTFKNINVNNCRRIIEINGETQTSNVHNYLSTTLSNNSSNSIILNDNSTRSDFNNAYSNWTALIDGANYRVNNYDANTKILTTTSNITPSASNGTGVQLFLSLSNSSRPLRDINFLNCYFNNSSNAVLLDSCERVRFIDCVFSSNTHSSANRFLFSLSNVVDATILKNTSLNNRKFIETANTSNIRILENNLINQRETNIYDALSNNFNMMFKNNKHYGFNATLSTASGDSYNNSTITEFYGNVAGNPKSSLLTLFNPTGSVGLSTENVNSNCTLDIYSPASRTFINFSNSNITAPNSNISGSALGSYVGKIRIRINDVPYFIPYYN